MTRTVRILVLQVAQSSHLLSLEFVRWWPRSCLYKMGIWLDARWGSVGVVLKSWQTGSVAIAASIPADDHSKCEDVAVRWGQPASFGVKLRPLVCNTFHESGAGCLVRDASMVSDGLVDWTWRSRRHALSGSCLWSLCAATSARPLIRRSGWI